MWRIAKNKKKTQNVLSFQIDFHIQNSFFHHLSTALFNHPVIYLENDTGKVPMQWSDVPMVADGKEYNFSHYALTTLIPGRP